MKIAGVSSFGFGGANAHVIISEYEDPTFSNRTETNNPEIIEEHHLHMLLPHERSQFYW